MSSMNKMMVFFVVVIMGVFVVLLYLNQNSASSKSPLESVEGLVTPTAGQISIVPQTPTTTQSLSTAPSPVQVGQEEQVSQKFTTATITTNRGDITLQLYPDEAPKTVANFIKKAQTNFYNNLTFHRVEEWVIQGGDPLRNGTGGGNMATEINSKPFVAGSLGVARGGDIKISNDSQFFITKSDASWLDNQYTNFGIVTSGMDVVQKIQIGDKIYKITVP